MSGRTLTHLRAPEAESIHILREVAAEFQRPLMLAGGMIRQTLESAGRAGRVTALERRTDMGACWSTPWSGACSTWAISSKWLKKQTIQPPPWPPLTPPGPSCFLRARQAPSLWKILPLAR